MFFQKKTEPKRRCSRLLPVPLSKRGEKFMPVCSSVCLTIHPDPGHPARPSGESSSPPAPIKPEAIKRLPGASWSQLRPFLGLEKLQACLSVLACRLLFSPLLTCLLQPPSHKRQGARSKYRPACPFLMSGSGSRCRSATPSQRESREGHAFSSLQPHKSRH